MLTPEPGTVVGEKYRILRPLGEGGMGTVYEAENLLTLKRAAIKWLHPRVLAVEEAGKRLLYEARAMARIRHRNVVDIYDVVVQQSSVFLVMELLLGEPLTAHLERGSLQIDQLIRLLVPAMRGMEAAHAVGVVHRDIKPDNIFLAQEGGSPEPVPKVIDFGISRVFSASDEGRLTRSGMTMGTPRYVSYEQLRGARDVDVRADVYAFGVIVYEGLVGHSPYDGTTLSEQAIRFATTSPQAPHALRPELPEALSRVVMAAIEKERDLRIPTMSELIARLLPFAEASAYASPLAAFAPRIEARGFSEHVEASPITATLEAPRPRLQSDVPRSAEISASFSDIPRRRRTGVSLGLVLITALGALAVWMLVHTASRPPVAKETSAPVAKVGGQTPGLPRAEAPAAARARPLTTLEQPPTAAPLAVLPAPEPDASAQPPALAVATRHGSISNDAGRASSVRTVRSPANNVLRAVPSAPSRRPKPVEPEATPPSAGSTVLRAGGMSKQEF